MQNQEKMYMTHFVFLPFENIFFYLHRQNEGKNEYVKREKKEKVSFNRLVISFFPSIKGTHATF